MERAVKLHSLTHSQSKTYLFAALFVAGNIVLPQLFHLVPGGGLVFLPIYFFTLVAAYKYGLTVGLLTAVMSPAVNHLLFGMPGAEMLSAVLVKSTLLAVAAAYAAKRWGRVSLAILLAVVLSYQIVGTLVEWAIMEDFRVAVQDFRMGIPGMALQVVGGWLALKALAKL